MEGGKGIGEAKEWKVEREWGKLREEGGKGMGEAKRGSSKGNGRN